MITGHMHNIIARTQFEKVRALVDIFDLDFPHWTTLFRTKARVREILNMDLRESLSVFDNKCYSLSLGRLLSLVLFLDFWLINIIYTD